MEILSVAFIRRFDAYATEVISNRVKAKEFLDMGIDTILTNDYLKISQVLRDEKSI